MTELTIDINDYISEADKRELARQAFRDAAARTSAADFERILSNAAYALARAEVDAAFNGNMVQVVREKALEVIKGMTALTVFKRADAWERGESNGWKILQQTVAESQPLITARVHEVIAAIDKEQLRAEIGERIASAILEKLTGSTS